MGPGFHHAQVQDVVALANHVIRIFGEALPDPSDRAVFDRLMHEARNSGMSWLQALENVAEQRRAMGA